MKMKRTSSSNFGFNFKVKVSLLLLETCFESENPMTMKRSFNRFVFTFSIDFFSVILFERCNSMKMKITLLSHFDFESRNSMKMKSTFRAVLSAVYWNIGERVEVWTFSQLPTYLSQLLLKIQ